MYQQDFDCRSVGSCSAAGGRCAAPLSDPYPWSHTAPWPARPPQATLTPAPLPLHRYLFILRPHSYRPCCYLLVHTPSPILLPHACHSSTSDTPVCIQYNKIFPDARIHTEVLSDFHIPKHPHDYCVSWSMTKTESRVLKSFCMRQVTTLMTVNMDVEKRMCKLAQCKYLCHFPFTPLATYTPCHTHTYTVF